MSYTLITTTLTRSNNNTEFQGWGKQISDAIANCGIIKESDANVGTQINWATAPAPTNGSVSIGYEIWKFDDAMQATTPVYFKLEYGSATGNTTPALWLTVGSGANGSGNVTGNTTTRQQIYSAVAAANITTYFAGANNRFVMSWGGGTVQQYMMIALERTLDANGTPDANGLAMIMSQSATKYQVLWTQAAGNVTPWETAFGVLTPDASINSGLFRGISGEHLAAYPLVYFNGAVAYPPQTMLLCYFQGEFGTGVQAPVPMYGSNVTYMPLGNTCLYGVSARGSSKTCWMMRFD